MSPQITRMHSLVALAICGIFLPASSYFVSGTPRDGYSLSPVKGNGIDAQSDPTPSSFDWSSIAPNVKLEWHPCFNGTECARLSVPMDHHNPTGSDQAAIALIRKASPLGADHPDYRGPILLNPGGPGGSGVELVSLGADLFTVLLGPQFDIVSFDPRGVGASLPHASFFKSNFERLAWTVGGSGAITDENLPRRWATTKVINVMAQENDDGFLRFINTDQTARDMLSIINAHGREKLQYWGLSYGAVLGSTFAAMFPDKVERLVIDGVPDADDYYSTMWSKNLIDTDKGIDAFILACHKAGSLGCAFWAPTIGNIRQNTIKLFDRVRRYPVSVANSAGVYGVVDIDLLQTTTFVALYGPYYSFPPLADAYAALSRGDGSLILAMNGLGNTVDCPADAPFEQVQDSQTAIICNDGPGIPSDLESTQKYFAMMKKLSPVWGPLWAHNRLGCIGWPKFENANFRGPFNTTTSYPILVVSNTADPVTPISGARKMSAGFSNSILLTQDSAGHCSLNAPSACTQSYIRNYFINGTLPEPGTVCTLETPIFPTQNSPSKKARELASSVSAEEQNIHDAIQALSRKRLFGPLLLRQSVRG